MSKSEGADYTALTDEESLNTQKVSSWKQGPLFVFLSFFFPACAGLLFGYEIGGMSAAQPLLSDTYDVIDDDPFVRGLVVSCVLGGACVGSGVSFYVGDSIGRRRVLMVAASLYMAGGALETMSFDVGFLVFARVVYGIGIGFAMHSAPIYISEMAPPHIRGLLVSLKEAFIVVGIVLGNGIGFAFKDTDQGWRFIFGFEMVLGAVVFTGMYFLPSSPRWLVFKEVRDGKPVSDKTRQLFLELRGNQAIVDNELQEIKETLSEQMGGSWAELFKYKKQLVVGVGMVFFQQITGQPSVLTFASFILERSGLFDKDNSLGGSLFIAVAKLVFTAISVFYVDKKGRKPLLITGISMMIVALLALSVVSVFKDSSSPAVPAFMLISLMLYVCGYQIGFGPIVWLLVSEIFPLRIRGRAISISVVTNFVVNLVVALAFPQMLDSWEAPAAFFVFGTLTIVSLMFTIMAVPETKEKTLEEIEAVFEKF